MNKQFLQRVGGVLGIHRSGDNPAMAIYHALLDMTVRCGDHDYLLLPLRKQNRELIHLKRVVDFPTTMQATSVTRIPRWLRVAVDSDNPAPFALFRIERRFLTALLFEALRGREIPAYNHNPGPPGRPFSGAERATDNEAGNRGSNIVVFSPNET